MKLHILSDLHVEFGDFVIPDVGADLIILAGDSHVGTRGVRWALDQKIGVPVIYVTFSKTMSSSSAASVSSAVRCGATWRFSATYPRPWLSPMVA